MSDDVSPSKMHRLPPRDGHRLSGSSRHLALPWISEELQEDCKTSQTRPGGPLDQEPPSKRKCTSLRSVLTPSATTEFSKVASSTSSTPESNHNHSESRSPTGAQVEDSPRTSAENTESATPDQLYMSEEDNEPAELLEGQGEFITFNVEGYVHKRYSAADVEAAETLLLLGDTRRISRPPTPSLPSHNDIELTYEEISKLIEQPVLHDNTPDVIDAANILISMKHRFERKLSRTSQAILEDASLATLNICPDIIEQVAAQVNSGNMQIFMVQNLPQGQDVFRAMEQNQYGIQFGSMPTRIINRVLPSAAVIDSDGSATERSNSTKVTNESDIQQSPMEKAVTSEDISEAIVPCVVPYTVIPDGTSESAASDVVTETLAPEDVLDEDILPEFVAPDAVVSDTVLPNTVLEAESIGIVPESTKAPEGVFETVAFKDAAINITPEAMVSKPGHEDVTSKVILFKVGDGATECLGSEGIVREDVLSEAVVLDTALKDIASGAFNSEADVLAVEAKSSKKSKKKKTRKTKDMPTPKSSNGLQKSTSSKTLIPKEAFLLSQKDFQLCAEKSEELIREMLDSLKKLLPHWSKQRAAKSCSLETGATSKNAQTTDEKFTKSIQEMFTDVGALHHYLQLATEMLFFPQFQPSESDILAEFNGQISHKFGVEDVATASWSCSSAPYKQFEKALNESGENNVHPSHAEIKSSAILSPDLKTHTAASPPTIPSDASQSLATPSEELSCSLSSTSLPAPAVNSEKLSPALKTALSQEIAAVEKYFTCDCANTTPVMKQKHQELRNPFSSFKRPRLTRTTSLPCVPPRLLEQHNAGDNETTAHKVLKPTEKPPASTTHVPVTREIVRCLLDQELPVYASWQIWYYPGPFSRGKGPRIQQIPLQVRILSVGQDAEHEPTYCVSDFGEAFDSRFVVSLEDGSFLPVIPTEGEHSRIMLSYKDYLEYDEMLSVKSSSGIWRHVDYSLNESMLEAFRGHMECQEHKFMNADERAKLAHMTHMAWDQMIAAAMQTLNENVRGVLRMQSKWKLKVQKKPDSFYKLSDTALKKWNVLQKQLKSVDPLQVSQGQLNVIQMQFRLVEAAITSAMTRAFNEEDPESYYNVDMRVEFWKRKDE